jgi:hypothetical protein
VKNLGPQDRFLHSLPKRICCCTGVPGNNSRRRQYLTCPLSSAFNRATFRSFSPSRWALASNQHQPRPKTPHPPPRTTSRPPVALATPDKSHAQHFLSSACCSLIISLCITDSWRCCCPPVSIASARLAHRSSARRATIPLLAISGSPRQSRSLLCFAASNTRRFASRTPLSNLQHTCARSACSPPPALCGNQKVATNAKLRMR